MLGYDLASFWDQTERTLQLAFDAAAERERVEYNLQLNVAWNHANMMKAKKIPPWSKLEIKPSNKKPTIPWQTKVEALKRWHVAMGGKLIAMGDKITKRGK
jgi:hypothetical protein